MGAESGRSPWAATLDSDPSLVTGEKQRVKVLQLWQWGRGGCEPLHRKNPMSAGDPDRHRL
jgi:hypothetical protein